MVNKRKLSKRRTYGKKLSRRFKKKVSKRVSKKRFSKRFSKRTTEENTGVRFPIFGTVILRSLPGSPFPWSLLRIFSPTLFCGLFLIAMA